jgi:hypothetical protein
MLKANNSLQKLEISSIFFLFIYLSLNIHKDKNFTDISGFADALKYNKSLTELIIEEGKLFLNIFLIN